MGVSWEGCCAYAHQLLRGPSGGRKVRGSARAVFVSPTAGADEDGERLQGRLSDRGGGDGRGGPAVSEGGKKKAGAGPLRDNSHLADGS